jgi:hypothetical protein
MSRVDGGVGSHLGRSGLCSRPVEALSHRTLSAFAWEPRGCHMALNDLPQAKSAS